jgi:nucleoside-diphosphate-sugar epimerase
MNRVLVTGSNGFIGSHLVERLAALNIPVLAADHRASRFGDLPELPGVKNIEIDLRSGPVDELVDGCEVVFHLAGRPGVRRSWGRDFGGYVSANVTATHRVADACFRCGVRRLVFASSSSVYGEAPGPRNEGDGCRPLSPYGVTKLAAEQLCLAYARRARSPLSVVALRYFTVYGPRQRPDMAISRMLFGCFSGRPFTLFGDGQQRREFTFVSDVVAATVAAGQVSACDEVVNVSGGTSVSMLEALLIAAEATGTKVPLHVADAQPGDAVAVTADSCRAHRLLGYRPQVALGEGMARQAQWMRGLDGRQLTAFTGGAGR